MSQKVWWNILSLRFGIVDVQPFGLSEPWASPVQATWTQGEGPGHICLVPRIQTSLGAVRPKSAIHSAVDGMPR